MEALRIDPVIGVGTSEPPRLKRQNLRVVSEPPPLKRQHLSVEEERGENREVAPKKKENMRDLLYEYSRLPDSMISDEDLHCYFVRRGGDPNHKLTERQIEAIRRLLNNWRVDGDFYMLPGEEINKRLFVPAEKIIEMADAMIAQSKAAPQHEVMEKRLCGVCMKEARHLDSNCPYIDEIPDPDNAQVGEGYVIRCDHCHEENHGHKPGDWIGYAFPIGADEF